MSEITFNVGGKELTAAQFKDLAEKAKPRAKSEPEPYFKGYKVIGHPPGYIAETERLQNEAHWAWVRMTAEEAKIAKRDGRKDPGIFVLDSWLRKNQGRRIERVYELLPAAQECMRLAVKADWEHVRIVIIQRDGE